MKITPRTAGVLAMTLATGSAMADLMVSSEASVYLAAQPNGASIIAFGHEDFAPDQSPASLVNPNNPGTSDVLQFVVTGETTNTPNNPFVGPDGSAAINPVTVEIEDRFGLTNITAPMSSLIGVFMNNGARGIATPADLDFSTNASRNFTSLSPELNQVFFIGDGMTDTGTLQDFVSPNGATTLYLGTMDRFGWGNNLGALDVTVVPAPGAAALAALGLGTLVRRRRN